MSKFVVYRMVPKTGIRILYVLGQHNLSGGLYNAFVNVILGLLCNGAGVTLLLPRAYEDDPRLREIRQSGGRVLFYLWRTTDVGPRHRHVSCPESGRDSAACGGSGRDDAVMSDPIQSAINSDLRSGAYTDNHMSTYDKIRLRSMLGTIRSTDAQIVVLPTMLGRIIRDVKEMGKKAVVHDHGRFFPFFYSCETSCAMDLVYGDSIVHADLILGVSEWHRNNMGMFVDGRRHLQMLPSDPATADTVRLVSPEDYVAPRFAGDHRVGLEKLRYMYNPFVPRGSEDCVTRKSLGIPGGSFVLVSSGRLTYRKRVDVTLAAYADFLAGAGGTRPAAVLLVLGDGAEYENLIRQARETGISDHVVFAGRVRDPHPYLCMSDAFVSTTNYELFSMSIGEASVAGIPVIAPRICSVPEIILDGKTGLLYEHGDVKDVTRCMQRLYDSPAMRKEMGAAGREFVTRNFAPGVIGRRLLNLYAECGLLDGAAAARGAG